MLAAARYTSRGGRDVSVERFKFKGTSKAGFFSLDFSCGDNILEIGDKVRYGRIHFKGWQEGFCCMIKGTSRDVFNLSLKIKVSIFVK